MLPLHRYAYINLSEMIGSRQVELGKVEGFRGSSKQAHTIFAPSSKPSLNHMTILSIKLIVSIQVWKDIRVKKLTIVNRNITLNIFTRLN